MQTIEATPKRKDTDPRVEALNQRIWMGTPVAELSNDALIRAHQQMVLFLETRPQGLQPRDFIPEFVRERLGPAWVIILRAELRRRGLPVMTVIREGQ